MRKLKLVRNKFEWTKVATDYVKQNYKTTTAAQMSEQLGVGIHTVRSKMYSLGLYRQESNYWTSKEISLLLENYQSIGDTELGKLLGRNKKQVEKKRGYLGLSRTDEQIAQIFQRNKANGRYMTEKCISARTSKENIEKRSQTMKNIWKREKRRQQALLPLQTKLLNQKGKNRPIIVSVNGKETHYNSISEAAIDLGKTPQTLHYHIGNDKSRKYKIRYAEAQTVKTEKGRTYLSETEFNYA